MKLKKATFFVTGVLTLTLSGASIVYALPVTNANATPIINITRSVSADVHQNQNSRIPFAEILEMDPKVLAEELKTGKTLNQIAIAKGMNSDLLKKKIKAAIDNNIDKAVAHKKITPEKANELKSKSAQKANKIINRSWTGHKGNADKRKHFHDFQQHVSEFLKIDQTEFRSKQKNGMSLKDIAKEKGIEEKELVSEIETIMKTHLDKAVKEQKITTEKALQIESRFPEMIDRMINYHTNPPKE